MSNRKTAGIAMNAKKAAKPATSAAAKAANMQNERWQGAVEGMHNGLLYGWAIDTENLAARVVVEICLNDEPFGCVLADVARTELAEGFAEHGGDPCHGFVAELGTLARSGQGTLTARVANVGVPLAGAVELHNPETPPIDAVSQVISDGALRLFGWAVDPADAARVVTVSAFIGHTKIAEAQADQQHPAARAFNIGAHGFSLDLPISLADGNEHLVRVVDEKGRALNGSPIAVCCYALGAKSLLGTDQPKLLADTISSYERFVPRSVSFRFYKEWFDTFEQAVPSRQVDTRGAKSARTRKQRIGIIVHGDADAAATFKSLELQRGVECEIYTAEREDLRRQSFHKLLKEAAASKLDAIGFIRAGDTLAPHALSCAMQGFADPQAQIVYSDSEAIHPDGSIAPWFKPAWNPEYAFATDYPLELMLARPELVKQQLKTTAVFQHAAEFQWNLLASLQEQATQAVVHVPRILYRFNTPLTQQERAIRNAAARAALQTTEPGSMLDTLDAPDAPDFTPRRLRRTLAAATKKATVSLIIPTRDRVELLQRCITTIQHHTAWPSLEIIVVDNDSADKKTKTYFKTLEKQGVRVLPVPGAFNFARLNNLAVEAAQGEFIGLINNDIEALHDGWLEEILSHLQVPGTGAVGAKLLWPNGMVQHGGVILGMGSLAAHYGNMLADDDWGDHGRNRLTHRVSGVTAACLFMRKTDYFAVGGMDETAFPVAFNDVDLCLKLGAAGKAIVWSADARLLHAESASRGHEDTPQKKARAAREMEQLRKRWLPTLIDDPHYHPSLNLDAHAQAFNGLALPPRDRSPRRAVLKTREAS